MKLRLSITLSVLLMLGNSSFSQEYSYTHYDVKDGLAGSSVYCITQDKQGFLWMGTDGGLSRFDGTHFKNFSLKDGLPDIEVLQIFADSRGRIWMAPFSKSICYYYEGKIHNQENDSLLERIRIKSGIGSFAEDKDGNILVEENSVLYLVTHSGEVREIDSIDGMPVSSYAVSQGPDGRFLVQHGSWLYKYSGGSFTRYLNVDFKVNYSNFIAISAQLVAWIPGPFKYRFFSFKQGKSMDAPSERITNRHVSFSLIGDSLVYRNGTIGVTEYNLLTGSVRQFPMDEKISRTFRDDEGNLWFTSLGRGIYRLNSENIRNIHLPARNAAHCVAITLCRTKNELLVGASRSMVFRFALPSFKDMGSYETIGSEVDEVHYAEKIKDGSIISGTTMCIVRDSVNIFRDRHHQFPAFSVKSACLKNDSELLAGGHTGVCLFDLKDTFLRIKDTLFRERATLVYHHYNTTYIGTLTGLYVMEQAKSPVYWGSKDPLFRKRISSIVQSEDSTLWIAAYGGGIIGWKNGRRVVELTRDHGLSNDLCRVLSLCGHTLWVGTDKGLNKVDIADPSYPVTTYTMADGLSSDIINTISADSTMVYVGTPGGLSFFDVSRVDATRTGNTGNCRLVLLALLSSGNDRLADTAELSLPYNRSNIRFEYAGISYRSAGDISYRYRLLGLDSSWKTTNESFLDYPTLPSGDYELQLQAVNKFGITSRMLSQHFIVAIPFWKTVWFDVSVLALFVFLSWLVVTLRIKHIRRRQAEQEELHKRMAETEHMALQAQMNPHFIFNCLNSIQQYIFDQDIQVANKYLTGFAKLIRATLYNSSKPFITLAEEIAYISAYLSLEKLRFKEKMDYTVEVAPSLRKDVEDIFLPPMLIQPYVENSMRHGLRHRSEAGGYIRINVVQEGDKLTFIIEDNGIGREQAARYKTREHIEYQSKGMSLTADRIRLINTVNGGNIAVEVFDLKDQQGEPCGTRVVLRFPRYDALLQKENI